MKPLSSPPLVSPPGLWRRTPPAIFPPMLGLLAAGLGWRLVSELSAQPAIGGLAEGLLGAALALYGFALVAYLAKPLRRPSVLGEELRILPGRAGVAAMILCLMLVAAVLVPYAPELAYGLVFAAMAALLALGAAILRAWITGPAEGRVVTPVFHLVFVGYILSPLALIDLGEGALAQTVLWGAMPVAVLIWAISARDFLTHVPPAPLRPLLAIHAAPASLFAIVAGNLGFAGLSMGFAVVAMAYAMMLAISARWMLGAGFSALWGALTFPSVAVATAVLTAFGETDAGLIIGAVLLFLASTLTAYVLVRVLQAWARGKLAQLTNAATA
jgi:tellurite resistance protein